MFILGISGKKSSGKTTAAEIIRIHYPSVHLLAFADELKFQIAEEFGVTVDYVDTHKDKFRAILQAFGVAKREIISPDYWILKLGMKLKNLPDNAVCIITDVRFKNELRFIKELSMPCWRITRIPSITDAHISETDVDECSFDARIPNNGTLDEFEERVINQFQLELRTRNITIT